MYKAKNYKKTIILETSKIKDAIKNLDATGLKLSVVVNKKKNFVGVLGDGDIRRALISGFNINSNIKGIINRFPLIVSNKTNEEVLKKKMYRKKIFQVPILNKNFLIGLYCYELSDHIHNYEDHVIIMSGGIGSRLRPLTVNLPKALVKINNKPILRYVIENIRSSGFKNFIISTRYKAKKIHNFFKNGKKFNVNIKYINEKSPLGTIGAISLIKEKLSKDFIVTNCDIISDIDYADMLNYHKKNNAYATIGVREFETRSDFGEISSDGLKVKNIVEKPVKKVIINAGIYAFNKNIIKNLRYNQKKDVNELIKIIIKKRKKVILYPIYEKWLDVGTKESLKIAKNYI